MVSYRDAPQPKVARLCYDSPAESLRTALNRAKANQTDSAIYLLEPCKNDKKEIKAVIDVPVHSVATPMTDDFYEDISDPEVIPGGDNVAAAATEIRLGVPTSEGVPDAWIADTGSGYDLVSRNEVSEKILAQIEVPDRAPTLRTADGAVKPDECVPVKLGPLPQLAYPLVLANTCLLYTSDAADE